MRNYLRIWFVCGLASTAIPSDAQGQAVDWVGSVSSDASNGANWGGGAVPGPTSDVEIRNGGSQNMTLGLGGANVTWSHVLFNHADVGTTVNGSGTITVNRPNGGTNIDVKGVESQGGERLSTINPNLSTNALIEARNGHDLVFNGSVTAHTIHAYEASDVIFNNNVTLTGFNNGGDFITGTGTVHFNGLLTLDRNAGGGFGFRNGMTAVFGPNALMERITLGGGFGAGLDVVNLYSLATVRVEGDNVIGHNTDLFSRYGGLGSGHDPNNTLDLNGHSDNVELLGTHPGANFIIDFGDEAGANSLLWTTTHHMPGTYEIINFEIGTDTLDLGTAGSSWWTGLDMETSGGGSPDSEIKKAQITINDIPYSAFDQQKTTPYWTVVDPVVSRSVEFFNLNNLPNADFDDNDLVDGKDFLIWQRNLGMTNQSSNANGDANRNGIVDAADLAVWKDAYGSAGAAPAAGAVPEPSVLGLGAMAALAITGFRRAKVLR